jgi:hypothetical protein
MRHCNIILLAATTFMFGCDPMARETISIRLPSANGANVATNGLNVIDRVLNENDFRSIKIHPEVRANSPSLVAAYGHADEHKLGCRIYERSGEIEIEFSQFGRFRLDSPGIRARDDLKKKLSELFGKENIRENSR